MMWNVASSTTFFKIKYIYFFLLLAGCFVQSSLVFFEFDGYVTNYKDSRYCGGNIKYKIHQI